MDPDQPPPVSTRKVKFAPKEQRRRKTKLTVEKPENEGNDEQERRELANMFRRANDNLAGRGPKVEKKSSSVQVVYGHEAGGSSRKLRSFGHQREGTVGKKNNDNDKEIVISSSPLTDTKHENPMNDGDHTSSDESKKGYQEPWDETTYYPTALPWRKPNSGNPELLDEQEFGGKSADMEYNESDINAAKELGLLEENEKERMIYIQLPTCGNRVKMESKTGGPMGKMLIYKSGTVKWQIGEVLFDVCSGVDTNFAQDVMVINTVDKECCRLGAIDKRAIVTPDIDFILDAKVTKKSS